MNDCLLLAFFLATVITVLYAIVMILLCIGWMLLKPDQPGSSGFTAKVSIIIPVRNEEKNIEDCIQGLIRQLYDPSQFEIIVVNDHSTDTTAVKVMDFARNNPSHTIHLITTERVPGTDPSKKIAITTGVKKSTGDLIITTDADCRFYPQWLRTIVNFHLMKKSVLTAGPVLFSPGDSLFGKIQALDYAGLTGVAAAGFGLGSPLFCSGSNLAFNKNEFLSGGSYSGNENVASGDDVFLLHRLLKLNKKGVQYAKSGLAPVYTAPANSLREFLNQRARWASKAIYYKNPFLITVSCIVFLCNLLLFALLIPSLIAGINYWVFWIGLFCIKSIIDFVLLFPVCRFFGQTPLLKYFLPAEALHIFYVTLAVLFGLTGLFSWKK